MNADLLKIKESLEHVNNLIDEFNTDNNSRLITIDPALNIEEGSDYRFDYLDQADEYVWLTYIPLVTEDDEEEECITGITLGQFLKYCSFK